eukprot:gene47158-58856_t
MKSALGFLNGDATPAAPTDPKKEGVKLVATPPAAVAASATTAKHPPKSALDLLGDTPPSKSDLIGGHGKAAKDAKPVVAAPPAAPASITPPPAPSKVVTPEQPRPKSQSIIKPVKANAHPKADSADKAFNAHQLPGSEKYVEVTEWEKEGFRRV